MWRGGESCCSGEYCESEKYGDSGQFEESGDFCDQGSSINYVITFGGLPPLPFVIFISLFMLCNGILKRRAGTAPILLHDTLCIFAEKVGFYQKK